MLVILNPINKYFKWTSICWYIPFSLIVFINECSVIVTSIAITAKMNPINVIDDVNRSLITSLKSSDVNLVKKSSFHMATCEDKANIKDIGFQYFMFTITPY